MVSRVGHLSQCQGCWQGCWEQHCGSWPASKLVTKCCHKNSCGLPSSHIWAQQGHVDGNEQEVGPGMWLPTTREPCQQLLPPEASMWSHKAQARLF